MFKRPAAGRVSILAFGAPLFILACGRAAISVSDGGPSETSATPVDVIADVQPDGRAAMGPDVPPPDGGDSLQDGPLVDQVGPPDAGPIDRTVAEVGTLDGGGDGSRGDGSGDDRPKDGAGAADGGLAPNALAVRFADAILARWPDPGTIGGQAQPLGWDYNIGIVLAGIQKVYERTDDPRYLAYIRRYIDAHVDATGKVDIAANTPHSLDLIQPAGLLLFLHEQTAAAKYDTAAQSIRARFAAFPKNADGGYWHKQMYPNEMWLDGIYMAEPFLVKFGRLFPSCGTFCDDTPVAQATLLASHVLQPSGLLVHAWDQDKNALWANPTTGNSPAVWGRGLGWFAMALVDILEQLPPTHAGRAALLSLLTGLAGAVRDTQDPGTGLWFQVVDQGARPDNWIETSASGMFVYALKVAVDRGYIDPSFRAVAQRGYAGLKTQVTTDAGGLPVINDAVQGMGVQLDYAAYVNQLRLSNSFHGLCAILMAASQMD
jgi:unsaturated rhamnogalacturonyl hydrolase